MFDGSQLSAAVSLGDGGLILIAFGYLNEATSVAVSLGSDTASLLGRLRADPSQCNSTNRQNHLFCKIALTFESMIQI